MRGDLHAAPRNARSMKPDEKISQNDLGVSICFADFERRDVGMGGCSRILPLVSHTGDLDQQKWECMRFTHVILSILLTVR